MINTCSSEPTRQSSVPSQKQFQNHFVWPDRVVSRERRKDDEEIEPASIADFGKKIKRPIFGQTIETCAPKENSNNPNTWNFIVGKGGVLVSLGIPPEGQGTLFCRINLRRQILRFLGLSG